MRGGVGRFRRMVTDIRAVPDDHVLKPLELRMLEMCNDMGPLRHLGGNFVAALRVFADDHPGFVDYTVMCPNCGVLFAEDDEEECLNVLGAMYGGDELSSDIICEWLGHLLCPKCSKDAMMP